MRPQVGSLPDEAAVRPEPVTPMLLRAHAVLVTVVLAALLQPASARAQDLADALRPLLQDNAARYAEPVSEGLGWSLGQPVADEAGVLPPLHFEVGARILAALPPSGSTTYEPVLPETVRFQGEDYSDPYALADGVQTSPTVVARGPGARLEPSGEFRERLLAEGHDPENFAFRLPDGLNLPAVTFPVAQGRVGVGLGTELTGSYTPRVRMGEALGSMRSRGISGKHEITHWFPRLGGPLSLAVEAGRTSFDVGDVLDGSASHAGVAMSGTSGILTISAQAGVQRSSVDVRYTAEGPVFEGGFEGDDASPRFPGEGEEVAFTSMVDTAPRFSVGARFRFYVFRLSTHFTLAEYNGASVKLGVGPP